jgi:hypothetical protein
MPVELSSILRHRPRVWKFWGNGQALHPFFRLDGEWKDDRAGKADASKPRKTVEETSAGRKEELRRSRFKTVGQCHSRREAKG